MKTTSTFKTALFLSLMACFSAVFANNIAVSNTKIHGKNVASDFQLVRFDVSWENSWRVSTNQNNWDAAWLFIKFRKNGSQNWQHATINYVDGTAANDGHTQGSGATIRTGTDGKGAFIYRSGNGVGNVNFTANSLRWNYGADGVADGDSVNVCVFAIEMVYVPQGQFYLGSGGSDIGGFYEAPSTANSYLVTSEAAITVGTTAGNLFYTGSYGDNAGPIPAAFPKGFAAFYCMKYEISQGQYAEFLNYLSSTQAATRFPNATGSLRHTIGGTHPNYTASVPNRACNYLSNIDGMAYADWSGLRPMSELEYEKACRGANQTPVANEFAFGSTTANNVTAVVNDGTASEAGNSGSNVSIFNGGNNFLMRTGAFAGAGSDRQSAGATYYGIMEMSGNVLEGCVTISYSQGRDNFIAVNGNGSIDANGNPNVTGWPLSGNQTTYGVGHRGGSSANLPSYSTTSGRYYFYEQVNRDYYTGYRAVRSAN
jgi:formylglycine-generating enzyme required for sulfatase activity